MVLIGKTRIPLLKAAFFVKPLRLIPLVLEDHVYIINLFYSAFRVLWIVNSMCFGAFNVLDSTILFWVLNYKYKMTARIFESDVHIPVHLYKLVVLSYDLRKDKMWKFRTW